MVSEGRKKHIQKKLARDAVINKYRNLAPHLGKSQLATGKLESRKKILVVCEGEKSEPQYIDWLKKKWRLNADIIVVEHGAGDPLGIVKRALADKKTASRDMPYDTVWVVFDKDDFTWAQINDAFQLAQTHMIKVAFNNESFELWYLLHFHYIETALGRQQLIKKLTGKLGFSYLKKDTKILDNLEDLFSEAIRNALKLEAKNGKERQNPYTSMYKLLVEFARLAAPAPSILEKTTPILASYHEASKDLPKE